MTDPVIIGDATLYLGDCLEILPTLEAGSVDAVVTDPPYGIGEARGKNKGRDCLAVAKDYGFAVWDDKPISQEHIAAIRRVSRNQILFGGNYIANLLPASSCWLVWNKDNGATDFADCELAWTSFSSAVRIIKWRWQGMLQEPGSPRETRVHPTQKPVGVFRWIIEHYTDAWQIVLDPFMGSGTTGVACGNLRRKFIGIELDPGYFDIACKRIEDAMTGGPLLAQEESK